MKLIDKKTIQESKSTERKKEIEEGMKLAKSVDTLREAQATEQVRLAKFRVESLKAVKIEIEKLLQQKKTLEEEIAFNISENNKREEVLSEKEADYLVRERALQDRYKTLERSEFEVNNRINDKKLQLGELTRQEFDLLEDIERHKKQKESLDKREQDIKKKEAEIKESYEQMKSIEDEFNNLLK